MSIDYTMKQIDLNADIGEADNAEWAKNEAEIVTAISSANIACGGHAGDADSMRLTVANCKKNDVTIGAHPAYPDRKNFGRRSLGLGEDITSRNLKDSLIRQIASLAEIAAKQGMTLTYIKPHGALYNDAVKDVQKSELIADVIYDLDPKLTWLGGPNSEMLKAAQLRRINFVAEGFIDRRYTDDGHLLPRSQDGAVIKNQVQRLEQARALASTGEVQTASGNTLNINARSLCVHGDSAGAVQTAREARKAIEAIGVRIAAFAPA